MEFDIWILLRNYIKISIRSKLDSNDSQAYFRKFTIDLNPLPYTNLFMTD